MCLAESPGGLSITLARSDICQQPAGYSNAQNSTCPVYFWGQQALWWELRGQFLGDAYGGQHLRMPGKGASEMGVCGKPSCLDDPCRDCFITTVMYYRPLKREIQTILISKSYYLSFIQTTMLKHLWHDRLTKVHSTKERP